MSVTGASLELRSGTDQAEGHFLSIFKVIFGGNLEFLQERENKYSAVQYGSHWSEHESYFIYSLKVNTIKSSQN